MACYFVTKEGDNQVLDIGNSVLYSMHGSHKVAHVYHPIMNCHTSGFCWWDMPEFEVHCVDNLFYWDALEKYKIEADKDRNGDNPLKYYDNIKNSNLRYSEDVGVYS